MVLMEWSESFISHYFSYVNYGSLVVEFLEYMILLGKWFSPRSS